MKTAISIPDKLLEQIDELARQNNLTRSKIFSLAAKEYIKKQKSKKMLSDLNKAYSTDNSLEDDDFLEALNDHFATHVLEDE